MRPVTQRLSPAIKALVMAEALIFAFYALVREVRVFFTEHLVIGPGFLAGKLWQPVSSLFVHVEPLGFMFNLIGLWFVGAAVERSLGTRRFFTIFVASGVAANVTMALLSTTSEIFSGCGVSILALFVAFGVIYDRTPVRVLGGLVLSARALTAILVAFALVADLTRGAWAAFAGDIVAIFVGFVLAGGRGYGLLGFLSGLRAKRVRRRYQVIEGGKRPPPRTPYVN